MIKVHYSSFQSSCIKTEVRSHVMLQMVIGYLFLNQADFDHINFFKH